MASKAEYQAVILGGDAPTHDMLRFLLDDEGYTVRETPAVVNLPSDSATGAVVVVIVILETPDDDLRGMMAALQRLGYQAPVVVLAHEITPSLRRRAFTLGVRDIISLPAPTRDLQARLLMLAAEHAHRRPDMGAPTVRAGGLTLHTATREICDDIGWSACLTERETALLGALMEQPGHPVARDALIGRVWGDGHDGAGGDLDVYVTRLCRKLAPSRLVRTVRGYGYAFDARAIPRLAPEREAARPPRVLIVDDDPDIVALLAEVLDDAGYVVVAALGQQAVRLARQLRPAVILLDIMMPELDGLTLRRRLREHPGTAGIPIIALSAGRTLREHAAVMDAVDYLSKPFDLGEALLRVEKWAGPPVPVASRATG